MLGYFKERAFRCTELTIKNKNKNEQELPISNLKENIKKKSYKKRKKKAGLPLILPPFIPLPLISMRCFLYWEFLLLCLDLLLLLYCLRLSYSLFLNLLYLCLVSLPLYPFHLRLLCLCLVCLLRPFLFICSIYVWSVCFVRFFYVCSACVWFICFVQLFFDGYTLIVTAYINSKTTQVN